MRNIPSQWLHDILTMLYQRRAATRSEIIETTRLNAGSVSNALQQLLCRGVVRKAGVLVSSGGRKPEVLEINPDAGSFFALDLGETRVRLALADTSGELRRRWEQEIEPDRDLPLDTIIAAMRAMRRQSPPLLAAGISRSPLTDAAHVTAALKKALRCPVFLERDDHAALLAERWLGQGRTSSHWLQLVTGRSVRVGIISDGEQVRGFRDMAGDIGHMTAEPGAQNLDAIASTPAILRRYLETSGTKRRGIPPAAELFERARHGDRCAAAAIEGAGRELGRALAAAANLLSPEAIILCGDAGDASDLFLPLIETELARLPHPPKIAASALGTDLGIKGAAALAFLNSLDRLTNGY